MISLLVFGLLGLALTPEDPSPSLAGCKLPGDPKVVLDVRGLPTPIQEDLRTRLPDLAPRDAKFQRGDQIKVPELPRRRLVGAVEGKYRWVVAYEHGTLDHVHVLTYGLFDGGSGSRGGYSLMPHANLVGPLCPAVNAALMGVQSADPGHL